MENVSRRWPRGNRSRLYSESTARSVNPRIMRESSFSRACRWWWYIDNGPQVGQQRSDKSSSRGSSTPSSSSLSFLSATQQCPVEALLYGRLRSSPRLVNDFRLATNLPYASLPRDSLEKLTSKHYRDADKHVSCAHVRVKRVWHHRPPLSIPNWLLIREPPNLSLSKITRNFRGGFRKSREKITRRKRKFDKSIQTSRERNKK